MKEKHSTVENVALQRVPQEKRKSWPTIAFIWSGTLICVPALMVGGMVTSGLTIGMAILSMILGYVLILAFMVPLGIIGTDLGLPTVANVSKAFGEKGSSILVSTIISVAMIGWFGFQTNVCANSFSMIMHDYFNLNISITVSSILWGMIMLATAVFGIGMIRYLNTVAVPLLLVGLIYGLYSGVTSNNGVQKLIEYVPETPMSILVGMNLTMAGFVLAAVTVGDYTRYCKSRKETLVACAVGVVPAGIAVLAIGGIMSIIAGTPDLTIVLSNTSFPILGLLVLIFATWTTATSSAYAAGLATLKIFNFSDDKRAIVTLALGVIGIALAVGGLIDHFIGFLMFLTNLVPPVAGVALSEYYIFCKGKPENWSPVPGINYVGVLGWLCGVVGSILLGNFFIPSVNAIVLAFIGYSLIRHLIPVKDNSVSMKESISHKRKTTNS